MSAVANNWLKDRPLFTMIISSLIAIIIPLSIFAMKQESEQMNAINQKIDKKADIEFVEKRISEHEKTDAARYQGIRDMFELTNESIQELNDNVRELRKELNARH